MIMSGSVFRGNGIAGVYATADAFNCVIDGCMLNYNGIIPAGPGGYGAWLNGSTHVVVSNCNIIFQYSGVSRTATGIRLDGADDCVLEDNIIYDHPHTGAGGYGIYLNDSLRTTVTGNQIELNDTRGIEETGTTDYTLIEDNDLSGNAGGAAALIGANNRLPSAAFQFTEPIGAAAIVVASPTGIDVDADTEGALAWGQIPVKAQQVHVFQGAAGDQDDVHRRRDPHG